MFLYEIQYSYTSNVGYISTTGYTTEVDYIKVLHRYSYVHPCIRAMSKLILSPMCIHIKTKSLGVVADESPLLSLLEGSYSCIVLVKDINMSA